MKAKIIGSGLSGITSAIILKNKGYDIKIYESRNHIGGNCYDSNFCGNLVHNYGPHIFHTDDEEVFKFLSQYTEWITFKLQPKGNTELGLISLPYSKKTIKEIGRELNNEEIQNYIFKDYSEKQWGIPFHELPKSITNRIPKTKDLEDPTWFEGQKYQCIPKHGYTKMMENMLKGINVKLNCNKDEWRNDQTDITIYTGKIDEYFNYCYGELPYRTLDFKHETSSKKQEVFIINQNNKNVSYTRKYDHSYLNENHKGITIITEEYPRQCEINDIPFYPMPFKEGINIYNKYKELAEKEEKTIFVGRLATYTYLDMWMAIKQVFLKLNNENNNSNYSYKSI
jgi:UDP-galactopyranose mutase